MRNDVRKLTLCAVLTAAALVTFVIELQLPPLTGIPGINYLRSAGWGVAGPLR